MKYQFISVTGKIFLSLLCLCLLLNNNTSAQTTANSFSSYIAYNGAYRYGANPGYYGSNWGAKEMAILAMGSASYNVKGAGVKSLRVPLYDDFLTRYGLTAELPKFQQYAGRRRFYRLCRVSVFNTQRANYFPRQHRTS
jgi:hypothetical protein